jgi:hypothetical protein
MTLITCSARSLPTVAAAEHAARVYPVNAPRAAWAITPARLAMHTTKYWGPASRRMARISERIARPVSAGIPGRKIRSTMSRAR